MSNKITTCTIERNPTIGELLPGECFTYENGRDENVYMKMGDSSLYASSVYNSPVILLRTGIVYPEATKSHIVYRVKHVVIDAEDC